MISQQSLLTVNPNHLDVDQRRTVLNMFDTLSFADLRAYMLRMLKPIVDSIRGHIRNDPVYKVDQMLDFADAFYPTVW